MIKYNSELLFFSPFSMFSLPLHITGYSEPHITTHLLGWYQLQNENVLAGIFGWETILFLLLAHPQWHVCKTFQFIFRHRIHVLIWMWQSLFYKDGMNTYYWMKGILLWLFRMPLNIRNLDIKKNKIKIPCLCIF